MLYTRTPADGATSFIGLVTDQPIRRALVIEAANDSDDLGYDNFVLGNQVLSAVPEPASATLLLGSLARRRRVSTN